MCILRLDRPQARNAMTGTLARAIAAIAAFEASDEWQVAIITGVGGHFCAGMDLKAFTRGEQPWDPVRGFDGLTEKPPAKPIIAAVEAYAVVGVLNSFWLATSSSRPRTLAPRIAEQAPLAVRTSKQLVIQTATWSASEMFGDQAPLADPKMRRKGQPPSLKKDPPSGAAVERSFKLLSTADPHLACESHKSLAAPSRAL